MHKIVCVGDSLTYGDKATSPQMSYPSILGSMLDPNEYEVVNLGVNGATMLKAGDLPYWNLPQFNDAMSSEAYMVILQLGTNDSKDYQWNAETFQSDFMEMVMML